MGFTYEQPVVGALAVASRRGKVLLVRRGQPPNARLWGFPGGKVELGERTMDAACRELLEETGLTARPGDCMPPIDVIHRNAATGQVVHYVLVPVRVHGLRGTLRAGDDAAEARWFALPELQARPDALCPGVFELAQVALAA